MTGDEISALVKVLADSDAVWIPVRDFNGDRPGRTYLARQDFPRHGVLWASDASSGSDSKSAQRTRDRLASKGLIQVFKLRKFKTSGVRLTAGGEAIARGLCDLTGPGVALQTMQDLAALAKQPGVWVSEECFFRPDTRLARGQEAATIEEWLLPSLVRGLVESNATIARNVFYSITGDGWSHLEDVCDYAEVEPDLDARSAYYARLDQSLAALGAAFDGSRQREIGYIPLPNSPCGRILPVAASHA